MEECQTCDREFVNWHAACQHMDALDHWQPQHECETCDRSFWSERACDQHMDNKGHWRHYCNDCEQRFDNANNLKMHLLSRTHQGENVTCPFCDRGFTTASGLSHHLENSGCRSAPGINRQKIYEQISARDQQRLFTNKLLGWKSETWSEDNAWNGSSFECYLCHREFAAQRHLDQHLKSPAHAQNIYHCPNIRCQQQFKALAALFNHLESESCNFIKFKNVQRNVSNFLSGNNNNQRQIGFY